MRLAESPVNEDGWRYLADDTSSPYLHVLSLSAPTTVAHRGQYFDSKINVGPSCDPVTAMATV